LCIEYRSFSTKQSRWSNKLANMNLRQKAKRPGGYREAPDIDCEPLEVAKIVHHQTFDPSLPPACFPTLEPGKYRPRADDKGKGVSDDLDGSVFEDLPLASAKQVAADLNRRVRLSACRVRMNNPNLEVEVAFKKMDGVSQEDWFMTVSNIHSVQVSKPQARSDICIIQEHEKRMDWARLNDGLKFLIYRTLFMTQSNNKATFDMLQLEGGDQDHFYGIYNREHALCIAFERAYEQYKLCLEWKPSKVVPVAKKIRKTRIMLPNNDAYSIQVAALQTELASVNRGRKAGFRKVADALGEKIRDLDLELERVDQMIAEQSPSPEARIPNHGTYKDPWDLTKQFLKYLDTHQRPTEYCLSTGDVHDGYKYLLGHGAGWWPRGVIRAVAEAITTYEGIKFTWGDLRFGTIYDPEEYEEEIAMEENSDQHLPSNLKDDDQFPRPFENHTLVRVEQLQQRKMQMAQQPKEPATLQSSPVGGSAEHTLSQVRIPNGAIQNSIQVGGQKKSDTLRLDDIENQVHR
jgi:hypothetical protein